MIKVLVVGMTATTGGVESVIMNYFRNVDKRECRFDFISEFNNIAYQDEILDMGSRIFKVIPRKKSIFRHKKSLCEIFKENRYDAIWVNLCTLSNISYLKYAKKYGVKVRIVHSHNSKNMGSKLTLILHKLNKKSIGKYATDFWACSDLAGKFFYSKDILSSNKYKIINNAIDVNKFKFNDGIRNSYRKELGIVDKFVVGHVGRFHFQKNHKFLINVFYELQKIIPNSMLLLVGDGEDVQIIKQQVEDLKIKAKVKFLGVRQDVNNIFMAMDCMVFPSLFEGLSVALLEAQGTGLPIFSSNTIAEQTKVNDNLKYLSLQIHAEEWAKFIARESMIREGNAISNLINHGFDITSQVVDFVELIKTNLKEE